MSLLKLATMCLLLVGLFATPVLAAGPLNVNTATEEELAAVPALGAELAKGIVEYRENIGDIKKMDELMEVKGVTPEVLEKLKQVLKIEAIEGSECNC